MLQWFQHRSYRAWVSLYHCHNIYRYTFWSFTSFSEANLANLKPQTTFGVLSLLLNTSILRLTNLDLVRLIFKAILLKWIILHKKKSEQLFLGYDLSTILPQAQEIHCIPHGSCLISKIVGAVNASKVNVRHSLSKTMTSLRNSFSTSSSVQQTFSVASGYVLLKMFLGGILFKNQTAWQPFPN